MLGTTDQSGASSGAPAGGDAEGSREKLAYSSYASRTSPPLPRGGGALSQAPLTRRVVHTQLCSHFHVICFACNMYTRCTIVYAWGGRCYVLYAAEFGPLGRKSAQSALRLVVKI